MYIEINIFVLQLITEISHYNVNKQVKEERALWSSLTKDEGCFHFIKISTTQFNLLCIYTVKFGRLLLRFGQIEHARFQGALVLSLHF